MKSKRKRSGKTNKRALLVVFDALRPEFVTPELMPNLNRFSRSGVHYVNSRSTFPSETRVNQSAITTGCYPWRHGVVANNFVVGTRACGGVLTTGDDVAFEKALHQMEEPFFGVPTLGERLAAAGRSYATISAGTSGGGRLINIHAEKTGSFRLALRRPEAAVPEGVFAAVTARIGDPPEYQLPALDWVSYAVDCYLHYVEPEIGPDVMLLWLCEPDETFHYRGIGSEDSLEAIAHADREFGRIVAHHEAEIDGGNMHVIAMSDHGQIALRGEPLDIAGSFKEAGFGDSNGQPGGNLDIAVANAGGIWVRDASTARVADMVAWLQEQDWCGPLFTRDGVHGTLTHNDVRVAHRRAADIAVVLRYTDENNRWNRAGVSLHASRYPPGGGSHGGLSPYEMHNFIAMRGARFRAGCRIAAPAGNVDIMPTLLHLLEIPLAGDVDGRVLSEAFADGPRPGRLEFAERTVSSRNARGTRTHLSVTEMDGSVYINSAWVD